MSEVSCRITSSLLIYAKDHEIPVEPLLTGIDIPEAAGQSLENFLMNTAHRICWDDFVTLLGNMEKAFGGESWIYDYMDDSFKNEHEWYRFARAACNFAMTPYRLYWLIQSVLGSTLFSHIEPTFDTNEHNEVLCSMKIPEGYRDCPLFFKVCGACFERVPALLNLPPALVTVDLSPRYAAYKITPPPSASLLAQSKRMIRSLASWPSFVRELSEQDQHLRDNYKQLLASQAELKRVYDEMEDRVHQRTRELEEANARLQTQIKEREEAEKALREAEARLNSIFNSVQEIILLVGKDLTCLAANAVTHRYGRTPDEVIGRPIHEFLSPDSVARFMHYLPTLLEQKQPISYEVPVEFGNSKAYHLVSLSPVMDGNQKVNAIAIVAHDISQQRQAVMALRESEAKYRSLVENVGIGVWALDENDYISFSNTHMTEMLGYSLEEIIGKKCVDFATPESTPIICSNLQQAHAGESVQGHVQFCRKDSQLVEVRVTATPLFENGIYKGLTAFISDITETVRREKEQEQFEAHLQQLQKMEAVGTLAGGVAHDFNNVLQGMYLSIALAKDSLPAGSPVAERLMTAMNYGLRGRDLVKQILAFSRKSEVEMKTLDIVPAVKEVLKLLRSTLPKTVNIEEEIHVDSVLVSGDITQVHQVLVNLCSNGAYAIEKNKGSDASLLTVRVEQERIQDEEAKVHGLSAGDYVKISVIDTGTGIPLDVRERIYDPFFTTKPVGEGSGMGLAVVHGIVKNHNGAIHFETEANKGSHFMVYLPLVTTGEERTNLPRPYQQETGEERILVIDDEAELALLVKDILEKLGYQVEAFSRSREALDRFLSSPNDFDLIFTDYSMPEVTGIEIQKQAHELRPQMPVILCTGYSDTIAPGRMAEHIYSITKPLERNELAAAVRKALDEAAQSASQKTPQSAESQE